ncbi:hypothetical protein PPGU16_22210 [Paraburkholderia largidicola]|uniref:Uncharacterized protein n=1 Tax=Paraburkholderia largidicola TaxID=3014751 RepID=A0A7I8BKB1_9BURK|nr:hypothetical protein PPGU16_22210 [Paraburkholderia sp. PGU16]
MPPRTGATLANQKQNADASENTSKPPQRRRQNPAPPNPNPKKPGPQGPQLHVSGIAAIVSGMALSKFPFLSLQAGKLLRSLALARLPR